MWLDPLVERKYLKNINVTTNAVNIRLELLKGKRATENKQVGILTGALRTSRESWKSSIAVEQFSCCLQLNVPSTIFFCFLFCLAKLGESSLFNGATSRVCILKCS